MKKKIPTSKNDLPDKNAAATKGDIQALKGNLQGLRGEMKHDISRLGLYIEKVNDNVSIIAEQYGGIVQKLDEHSEMFIKMLTEMGVMKEDIEIIKHGLRRRVDIEDFAVLERRVTALERKK